jgi:hypothetical protein
MLVFKQLSTFFEACCSVTQNEVLLLQVVFRKSNAAIGNPGLSCSTIEIEEHTDCKCGCDVEAVNCTTKQVSFIVLRQTKRHQI